MSRLYLAMQASLSSETAYLILDCTQVGRQCRTLMAALAYHETVLPLGWQSIQGKKGHVTGAFQQALLERLQPYSALTDTSSCWATLNTATNR